MVTMLSSQKMQMFDAAAMNLCAEDGSPRDRSTNNLQDSPRVMKHREKLFAVSKRYFASEEIEGVAQPNEQKEWA
jgi:hypothetical protein